MNPKPNALTIVDVLWKEKDLVFQEKLGAVKTSKQGLAFLIPFLGFAIELASRHDGVYLLIPPLISAFGFFMLANQWAQIWFTEYISRIEQELVKRSHCPVPLFQQSIGDLLIEVKFNVSKGLGVLIPHPYYLFVIALLAVVLPIYIHSTFQGYSFLIANGYGKYSLPFVLLCSVLFLAVGFSGYTLRARRQTIQKMIDQRIQQVLDLEYERKSKKRVAGT